MNVPATLEAIIVDGQVTKILSTEQLPHLPLIDMSYDALVDTGTVKIKSIFETMSDIKATLEQRLQLQDERLQLQDEKLATVHENMRPLAGQNLTLLAHEVLSVCRYKSLKVYTDDDSDKEIAALTWFKSFAERHDLQEIFESASARNAGINRTNLPDKLLKIRKQRHGVAHAEDILDLRERCRQAKGHCKMLKRDVYYSTVAFVVKNASV